VDEYQDTNRVQYELMRLLTGHSKMSVCRDEDNPSTLARPDVSILLSFSKDFPAARIVRLERNYRSTQNILNAAGSGREHPERLGKSLSAEKGEAPISGISKRVMPRPRQNSSQRTRAHPE